MDYQERVVKFLVIAMVVAFYALMFSFLYIRFRNKWGIRASVSEAMKRKGATSFKVVTGIDSYHITVIWDGFAGIPSGERLAGLEAPNGITLEAFTTIEYEEREQEWKEIIQKADAD